MIRITLPFFLEISQSLHLGFSHTLQLRSMAAQDQIFITNLDGC